MRHGAKSIWQLSVGELDTFAQNADAVTGIGYPTGGIRVPNSNLSYPYPLTEEQIRYYLMEQPCQSLLEQ